MSENKGWEPPIEFEIDERQGLIAFNVLLATLRNQNRPLLREVADSFKRRDSVSPKLPDESTLWWIGEMIERTCIYLNALEYGEDGTKWSPENEIEES